MTTKIGVTEHGDPALDDSWKSWVRNRKPAILITKNFKKLYEENPGLLNQNVMIHATITGYGSSPIEPGVPDPRRLIEFLESLSSNEKAKITVRIDPIIPTEDCVNLSVAVFHKLSNKGFRDFRISVLDCYKHVFDRIQKNGFSFEFAKQIKNVYRPIEGDFKWIPHADYNLRKKIIGLFPGAKTCCEPGFDETNVPCVGKEDVKLLGIKMEGKRLIRKGQREFCGCCSLKHELLQGQPCGHKCIYCYRV